MEIKQLILLITLTVSLTGFAQTFSGIVVDAKTKTPLESVSVYFDNTTIGTATNLEGEFSITFSDAIQSGLVISYLGYQTQTISDYREKNNVTFHLKPATNFLNEVVINTDDGLTRNQKLKLFRVQFLGESRFGRSCKILNEDDLILRYNKREKTLTASSISPLIIENKALQYQINFDIQLFEIYFNSVKERSNIFNIYSVSYNGSTFYKNFENFNEKKAERNRAKVYDGSIMQFMRALYNENLIKAGYQTFHKGFPVTPWRFFKVEKLPNSTSKRVFLDKDISLLYKKQYQSAVEFLDSAIILDVYGNYFNINRVLFSGYMGNQRVGDSLPFGYGL